jgi:hypothetical protein
MTGTFELGRGRWFDYVFVKQTTSLTPCLLQPVLKNIEGSFSLSYPLATLITFGKPFKNFPRTEFDPTPTLR